MFFASDNAGPAHPKLLEALVAANDGYAKGYGAEPLMDAVRDQVRVVFEAPEAAVYLVVNGTSANAILLGSMTQPWQTVFCSDVAHIHEDECNAPEFYTQAKLTLVPSQGGRMRASDLQQVIGAQELRGVHGAQRGPVSLTQVTEKGEVYALEELRALTAVAKASGLQTHMDGARFANALVALGCSAADMTWRAGVDTVSFGATKNGALGVEACVIFDPALAWEFELRRKRGGHLLSKHRYLSAQMQAYLQDGLWLELAAAANAACARLLAGLRAHPAVTVLGDPRANMIFFHATRREHQRLAAGGAVYYVMDGDAGTGDPDALLTGRLVTDWSMTDDAVDRFLALLHG